MPQRRESQHCYLGLTASQTSDLLLKGRTCEGAYWSKWSKWEQSARESSFNLCHTDKKTSCCNCKVPVIMQSCERTMYTSVQHVYNQKGYSVFFFLPSMRAGNVSLLLWIIQHLNHRVPRQPSSNFKCRIWLGPSARLSFLFFFNQISSMQDKILVSLRDFLSGSRLHLAFASFCPKGPSWLH